MERREFLEATTTTALGLAAVDPPLVPPGAKVHLASKPYKMGYIQTGDVPGRKEPGTGEVNYRNVFKAIHDKGYRGIIGMEHGWSMPGKEGFLRCVGAYRDADDFEVA